MNSENSLYGRLAARRRRVRAGSPRPQAEGTLYAGRRVGTLLAIALMLSPAGARGSDTPYGEAELRAIFFNREKAAEMEAPVVLLAHRTRLEMKGNGVRERHEHQVWYVADPQDPSVQALRNPRVLLDRTIEGFGLKRFRIHRAGDTLDVPGDLWQPRPPADWPATGHEPWVEASAEIPPLEAGDVVEFSYTRVNHWGPHRVPSDWDRILIRNPLGPTIERHIVITHPTVIEGNVKVIGDERRLIRHYGRVPRMVELLTGNLPPADGDEDSLRGPCVLFTAGEEWWTTRRAVAEHYVSEMRRAAPYLLALGDSLMRAHGGTRARLDAIFAHLEQRCARIPRTLVASDYYPRPLAVPYFGIATDPIDRALLVAAIAEQARLKVDLFFGRTVREGFDPQFVTPMQFDRLLVRVFIAEEDRELLIDPWQTDLQQAAAAVPADVILLGIPDEWARLLEIDPHGQLVDYSHP